MLVLALDTTTRRGSCAVVQDGEVLRVEVSDPARAHATRLPADLMRLLAYADLHLRDVDVFAVATGPGSFTGLRIGIATMQGLAFATDHPLLGVSTLDALATIAGPGRVATWVDAWRGEVYAATYEDGVALAAPTVALPADLIRQINASTTFIGDGAETFAEQIRASLGSMGRVHESPHPPLAAVIARLAGERVRQGERPGPDEIRAVYVRRPDPELTREAQRGE